jgi:Uma2 family endonuclease
MMAKTKSPRPLTAELYARLPENETHRDELIRGVVCVQEPLPAVSHGEIDGKIFNRLYNYVTTRALGKVLNNVGFLLERNPDTVRGPDVAFITNEHAAAIGSSTFVPGAPDLAVEVLSPSNTKKQMAEKVALYLRVGSRLVWTIHPRQRVVTIYRPQGEPTVLHVGDTLSGEQVVPGFEVPIADLFPSMAGY